MAFPDPVSITPFGGVISLPRLSVNGYSSTYGNAADKELVISHAIGKRNRRTFRFNFKLTAPDPLFPASNVPYSMATYLVVDAPPVGIAYSVIKSNVEGLMNCLLAGSSANLDRLLTGQS